MLSVPEPEGRDVAIEVRGLVKTFRMPTQRVDTLKERATSLLSRREYRRLEALRGIDFHVNSGDFFGIVGRNGSGKSTLLKLLASIYRADAGRIRIAGRIAPCIELGVGFNPELAAYENVVLNGVMMGLAPREARARFRDVIDFAELGDYTELKLKNYSSGMLVRLGFSLMTQVDADVLLVDEVLAVGDAAFQQKCMDAFARLHQEGKTIILVTHDMATVASHCDRAILIEGGEIVHEGDPSAVARHYLELNFPGDRAPVEGVDVPISGHSGEAEIVDTTLFDSSGEESTSFEQGEPIVLEVTVKATANLPEPVLGLEIRDGDGRLMFAPAPQPLASNGVLSRGETVRLRARFGNPLASGHYFVSCGVGLGTGEPRPIAFRKNAADFVVFGTRGFRGLVELDFEAETLSTPERSKA
jgi:ABC-2 type transport system ATP-binding protein